MPVALLGVLAATILLLYAFKMRRATALLERLAAEGEAAQSPTESTPEGKAESS